MTSAALPVVVIGAGPVGLAAAARLIERGLAPFVLERDDAAAGEQGCRCGGRETAQAGAA